MEQPFARGRIRQCHAVLEFLRRSDHIARLGGDEFGFLITSVNNRDNIERAAEKIFDILEQPIDLSEFGVGDKSISGSLGFAIFPDDTTDLDKIKIFSV